MITAKFERAERTDMERLQISNFLSIKNADVSAKKITILIGPQASGKSVIAKLFFFFGSVLGEQLRLSAYRRKSYEEFVDTLRNSFTEYFDSSYLQQSFHINYERGGLCLVIRKETGKGSPIEFDLGLIQEVYNTLMQSFIEALSAIESEDRNALNDQTKAYQVFTRTWLAMNHATALRNVSTNSVFIPASRSFFLSFSDRMFSFLSAPSDKPGWIDPVLKEFGDIYEWSKGRYNSSLTKSGRPKRFYSKVKELRRDILVGEYIKEGDGEYIKSSRGRN